MKLLFKDLKKGIVKLRTESPDDLWVLSNLVSKGDVVKSFTERKIKLGSSTEKSRVIKKKVFLSLLVDRVFLDDDKLRILGFVNEEKEDIPKGSSHSFNIFVGDELTIIKDWQSFELKLLDEAFKSKKGVLILLFDREEARFYFVNNRGVDELSSVKGDVSKKAFDVESKKDFFKELRVLLLDYYDRLKPELVVVGSPAFWIDYFKKEPLSIKNLFFTSVSSVEKNSINELLRRPEFKNLLRESRSLEEASFFEEVMKAISQERAVYGFDDVKSVLNEGNVKVLFVTDSFIKKARDTGFYDELNSLLRLVESLNGEVHLITSDDNKRKFDNLGGIILIKRW